MDASESMDFPGIYLTGKCWNWHDDDDGDDDDDDGCIVSPHRGLQSHQKLFEACAISGCN